MVIYDCVTIVSVNTLKKYLASVPRQPHLLGKGCSCI